MGVETCELEVWVQKNSRQREKLGIHTASGPFAAKKDTSQRTSEIELVMGEESGMLES